MSKFDFRLQPVLDLKVQMEENLKNEFGKVTKKLEDEKKILNSIELDKEEQIDIFSTKLGSRVEVSKLRELNGYISLLGDKIEMQKENVNEASNIVDSTREKLLEAVKDRKIIDKLREKMFTEYSKQQLREEQKIIDEVVSFKHGTKISGV